MPGKKLRDLLHFLHRDREGCAEELETMITHSKTDSRHWACQANSSEIPFTSYTVTERVVQRK